MELETRMESRGGYDGVDGGNDECSEMAPTRAR